VREFVVRFGAEPAGVWSAPGRVNLIGEHTDYNDGYVLPFAIPMRTAVAASPADGPQWTVFSRESNETITFGPADLTPGRITGWGAYAAAIPWALRDQGYDPPPANLAIATEIPLGAGLSSSAAILCAVLAALDDLGDLGIPRDRWPTLAQLAENKFAGVPSGIMDQSASTLCEPGHAMFLDCRTLAREQVPFALAEQGLAMLVVDTRAPHRHAGGEYATRRAACESAARKLGVTALRDLSVADLPAACERLDPVTARRVRHVVTENERVLDTVERLRGGAVAGIGPLLTASHASMRDDYEITVAEVDVAVEAAMTAGAYGARMTGGGFGGCVLALVDAPAVESVAAAVTQAFAGAGFAPPTWFAALAAGGVARER
jgi:galactokinase